jgi:hypothetical protein
MNAQAKKIPHNTLDNLKRIGRIHHQPPIANERLGLAPERRDVFAPSGSRGALQLMPWIRIGTTRAP